MKVIFVLLDSLNRHYLPVYGNAWVKTPCIDAFASGGVVFDNHWLGSAPCMPARRDMLTGRLGFLERQWGGLEPYDITLPRLLRQGGVYSRMETDHYHYFHVGGENYHTPFSSWQFHRGQENDVWAGDVASPPEPEHLGKWMPQYDKNRARFATDADYPTPKTFAGAIDWLRRNRGADNYFLWVEGFDPHEPFDCPPEFLDLYGDDYAGARYDWSGYERVEEDSPATRHLQRRYAATLTMTDKWFGRLIDEVRHQGGLEDTLIILTTDHGHMLGERGLTGKNHWHAWNEMARIPLIVHLPGGRCAGQRRTQLTQNIDLMPTVLDYFGLPCNAQVQGHSWKVILEDAAAPWARRSALYGWFGQTVNVTDGRFTYFRAPIREDNQPLHMHFLVPTWFAFHDMPDVAGLMKAAELGRFLPYVDYPVLRVPVVGPKRSPEWGQSRLYDLGNDPGQTRDLCGGPEEKQCAAMLAEALRQAQAPPSQHERLGLETI